jgi:hypothetical protein
MDVRPLSPVRIFLVVEAQSTLWWVILPQGIVELNTELDKDVYASICLGL